MTKIIVAGLICACGFYGYAGSSAVDNVNAITTKHQTQMEQALQELEKQSSPSHTVSDEAADQ